MNDRFILCRPDAGLNDILCQIELMHRYATQTNRILIVDTAYENSLTFRDCFANYFQSKESNLLLSVKHLDRSLDELTIFPPELQGRINSYFVWASDDYDNIVDRATGVRLSFDLSKDYRHQLLVHHAYGGGVISLFALTKLILNENIVDLLGKRIDSIGAPYSAIHIRNTDYQTRYTDTLERIKNTVITPVFIATDNLECRNYCIRFFGEHNVRYFSELPDDGKAIHYNDNFGTVYQRNVDAILDLLILGLSTKFHRFSRDGTIDGRVNGYTTLAENLISHDGVLLSLLGTSETAISILRRAIDWRRSIK